MSSDIVNARSISAFKHKPEFVDFTPFVRNGVHLGVCVLLLCYFHLLGMRQCLSGHVYPDFCLNKWIWICGCGSARGRTRSQQELERVGDRLRQSLDAADNERRRLEQLRQSLAQQLDELSVENHRLQTANSDLQRQRDQLEDEKTDLFREQERQNKERERWSVWLGALQVFTRLAGLIKENLALVLQVFDLRSNKSNPRPYTGSVPSQF